MRANLTLPNKAHEVEIDPIHETYVTISATVESAETFSY